MIPTNEGDPDDKFIRAAVADEVVLDDTNDNFIADAMKSAFDPKINMVRDLRVDDRELGFATNYYDWCANHMGTTLKMPFARQLWMCLMLANEICPKCSSPRAFQIDNIPVDLDPHDLAGALTLFEHGVCPSCGTNRYECIKEGLIRDYNEAVWVIGQRAGKSTTASGFTTYVFHRMLKSPKLGNIATGIQSSTQLTASFVALSVTNAYKLLWIPVRDTIIDNDWFRDYMELMTVEGRRMGKELLQFNPTGTYFRSFLKNIDAFPVGPSKRALRGPTRFIALTDELGHFPFNPIQADDDEEGSDERERANADEVHMVLTNSLTTVRAEVITLHQKGIFTYPQGFNLSISSPASWNDKIMRLLKESENSTDMFGVHKPTWEISPIYTRDHPVIASMYSKNPRKAERDFGANPPRLSSTVFAKEGVVSLFKRRMTHAIRYDTAGAEGLTSGSLVTMFEESRLAPAVLSLDAGLTNNSFALSVIRQCSRLDSTKQGFLDVPVVAEIIPQNGCRVDFVAMYQKVIKPLIKALNVRFVCADRWNSEYLLRLVETDFPGKVIAKNYRLKSRDFDRFIEYVHARQFELPIIEIDPDRAEMSTDYKTDLKPYPAAHLYRQFLTVQQFQGMLVKGSDSTDDILRSLVLGTSFFFDEKFVREFNTYPVVNRDSKPTSTIILVAGRSGVRGRY